MKKSLLWNDAALFHILVEKADGEATDTNQLLSKTPHLLIIRNTPRTYLWGNYRLEVYVSFSRR